jgi:hypothetical protein
MLFFRLKNEKCDLKALCFNLAAHIFKPVAYLTVIREEPEKFKAMRQFINSISISIITIFFISFGINAQSNDISLADLNNNPTIEEAAFIFASQAEDNKYFLDLEMLEGEFSDLIILNELNDAVASLPLTDLPANTIYELDLSDMEKGNYTIQVRTFRQEVKSNVTVQ